MKDEAERLVKTYVDIANRLYALDLQMPKIEDNLRGHHLASYHCVPGRFEKLPGADAYRWEPMRDTITLNKFYFEHYPNYLEEVIPHEVAHYVKAVMHEGHTKPHGIEWKDIMRAFGREPSRTVHCDVVCPGVWKRYEYVCECNALYRFTNIVARRILEGKKTVVCWKCGTVITPRKLEGCLTFDDLEEIRPASSFIVWFSN